MTPRLTRRLIVPSFALLATLPAPFAWGIQASPGSGATAATQPTTRRGSLDPQKLEAAADAAARDFVRPGGPGFAVALAKDGQVVFQKAYGKADVEMDVDAKPETIYRIGSLAKQFTASAVMRLVEQGKISLDDPITKYLPNFPTQGHTITIRHLLNHTSGIKNYTGIGRHLLDRDFRHDMTYEDMVGLVGEIPFDFAPGEQWRYNNTAYWLLGEIITRVSGMPYDQYLEQELLRPLGLAQTLVADHREILPNRAEGYQYQDGKLTNAPFISMHVPGGGGALSSTVGDLVRWSHLLHSGKVVSPESYQQMLTRTKLADGRTHPYGFGLGMEESLGQRAIAHGGGIFGFTAYLIHYPEEGLSIAVLANERSVEADEVARAMARETFGIQGPMDLPLTPEEMARYVGTYVLTRDAATAELLITIEDGRLRSRIGHNPGTMLRHYGDHTFAPVIDLDSRLIFEMSADGTRAEGVTLKMGENEANGRRKE